jgi:hypothetical protein
MTLSIDQSRNPVPAWQNAISTASEEWKEALPAGAALYSKHEERQHGSTRYSGKS